MAASQANVDAWWSWATGVLNGIGAPTNAANYATLWNWSIKESGQDPIVNGSIHNNPLNTTQTAPGSTSQNSVGVQSFPDISTGVSATVQTLTNGRYPQIVANLKNSIPSYNWLATGGRGTPTTGGAVSAQLGTWGSGTNWLAWTNSPPTPSQNFQTTSGVSSLATNPSSNPVTDAINSALGNALGPIGTAITSAETSFVQTATNVVLMLMGAVLMLAGIAVIAVLGLGIGGAAGKVTSTVASATPVGRAAAVAKAVKPAPSPAAKPLSPAAQSSIAAAKAGRGSKLSPEVRAEMKGAA